MYNFYLSRNRNLHQMLHCTKLISHTTVNEVLILVTVWNCHKWLKWGHFPLNENQTTIPWCLLGLISLILSVLVFLSIFFSHLSSAPTYLSCLFTPSLFLFLSAVSLSSDSPSSTLACVCPSCNSTSDAVCVEEMQQLLLQSPAGVNNQTGRDAESDRTAVIVSSTISTDISETKLTPWG